MTVPSNPGWAYGYVPSPGEWNNAFAGKVDYPAPVAQGGIGAQTSYGGNYNLQQRAQVLSSTVTAAALTFYSVRTDLVACAIALPAANSCLPGDWIDIFDSGANAAVNNITITAASSDAIIRNATSTSSLILRNNGARCILVSDGSAAWRAQVVTQSTGIGFAAARVRAVTAAATIDQSYVGNLCKLVGAGITITLPSSGFINGNAVAFVNADDMHAVNFTASAGDFPVTLLPGDSCIIVADGAGGWWRASYSTESITDAPNNGLVYGRTDATWAAVTEEAPEDSIIYGRKNGGWVAAGGGGGSIEVSDGTTTVNPASALVFTIGAVVTDAGGGIADVAITGINALGEVLVTMPPTTNANTFAAFNTNVTGNYYLSGFGFTTLADWLSAASGSFTRSGNASYVTSAGLIAQASAGVPRLTYDPVTLAPLGLLYEAAGANLWPYSNKGNAGGSSSWNFSPTGITMTDNAATGADGTASAFTIRETATTGLHQAFYDAVTGPNVIAGHFYAAQFLIKPAGRTKFTVQGNAATGMPDTTVDLTAVTATNGYALQVWHSGYYLLSRKFTGAGAGTDTVFFILALNDASGASSYAGDVTKGINVDNVMLSEIASLTASLPSMIYRPSTSAATRSADALLLTLPTGATKATYTFGDGTQQIVTVAAGSYTFPTTLNEAAIQSFITADLSVVGTLVTSVAGRTGAVTLTQADVAGLTTASTPSFTGATVSGGLVTVGTATLKVVSTLFQWTSNGPALTSADRGVIIGANTFGATLHASYTNSVGIGQDACADTITIATATVIGDTAGGSASVVQSSCLIGNEAGNTSGTIQACNITGNTSGKAGNYLRSEIYGQASATFNSLTDTVSIGNQTLIGSSGSTCTVTNSVVIGSGAGSSVLDAAHGTVTNLILIGKSIQPPTATTSNYYSFGNAFTYLGSTSTITLQTPAAGKAKLVFKGLAASTSYANDAAAAAGGVGIDEAYRNGSVFMVRVT